MIPYTRFYNEQDGPPEGIDTVSIWVNPDIINRIDDFHREGNIHESINCRWSEERIPKTGQFIRNNYFIDIQAEALNPNADILGQIIYLLTGFVYAGIIGPFRNEDMPTIAGFFMDNFSRLFAINFLDFNFV
jgi:hypothetical protein